MDISLTPKRIFDVEIIWAITGAPEIADCIKEDGVEITNSNISRPNVIDEFWISMINEKNEIIGCYNIHQEGKVCWHIHAFILRKFRKTYSALSGKTILKWLIDNTKLEKLVTTIPVKYKNVYEFTKRQGFKDEGLNRMSYLKDGELWDQHILGITRSEIEGALNE